MACTRKNTRLGNRKKIILKSSGLVPAAWPPRKPLAHASSSEWLLPRLHFHCWLHVLLACYLSVPAFVDQCPLAWEGPACDVRPPTANPLADALPHALSFWRAAAASDHASVVSFVYLFGAFLATDLEATPLQRHAVVEKLLDVGLSAAIVAPWHVRLSPVQVLAAVIPARVCECPLAFATTF